MAQPHVVFMNIAASGHMNPTLPVVAELVARGCKVTYFVDKDMRAVVEATGASWMPFRYPGYDLTGILMKPEQHSRLSPADRAALGLPEEGEIGLPCTQHGFPFSTLYTSQLLLPNLLDDLRALSPPVSAIVSDPFIPCGRVAGHVLGVPPVGTLTMPGPGVITMPKEAREQMEALPWVDGPRRWIQARYGVDVFADGALLEFYSPVLNLVTTVQDLYVPPTGVEQVQRFGASPFKCVGALLDPRVKRIQHVDVALARASGASVHPTLQQVCEAKAAGRRVVLASLGTVVTGHKWSSPLGPHSASNDGRPEGARSLCQHTGKEFALFVYRALFGAAAEQPDTLFLLSLGPHGREVDELGQPPANVSLHEAVPQLELLPLCDAFVTHGGANSMHEALAYAVPMCVVPVFGDQPTNADTIERIGAGVSFRHPLLKLSSETLAAALRDVAAEGSACREAARRTSAKLAAAEGVLGAAEMLLQVAGGPLPTLLRQRSAQGSDKGLDKPATQMTRPRARA